MRFTVKVICVAVALSSSVAQGQTLKDKVQTCVEQEIAKYKIQDSFSARFYIECRPGYFQDLFRCVTENKRNRVAYSAPDGYRITEAKLVRDGSPAARTHVEEFEFNDKAASITQSCNGYGCDGKGGVSRTDFISGTIERIPKHEEVMNATRTCLENLLR